MARSRISSCVSVLTAIIFWAVPACAADVAGKWYGETDLDPVIIIDKSGSEYSGSLVNIDSTRQHTLRARERVISRVQSVHKSLLRLAVAGGNVRFTIAKSITANGDIDYERDQYNLNLSEDGLQLVGTVSHLVSYESAPMPLTAVTPITLFSTDWNSRAAKPQGN